MREQLDILLNNTRDRFTNPLVFSILCSWIVINWRVVVALLWTDTLVYKDRPFGFSDYIAEQFNWCSSVFYPILSGTLLVLVLPIAKVLLQMFLAYVQRQGTKHVLKIQESGSISVSAYMKLRRDYNDRTKQLITVIEEETSSIEANIEKDTQLIELKQKVQQLTNDLAYARDMYTTTMDVQMLDGWWRCNYQLPNEKDGGVEFAKILHGQYMIAKDGIGTDQIWMFNIVGFRHDSVSGKITFVKELTIDEKKNRPQNEHYAYNELHVQPDGSLSGKENGTTTIRYTRVHPTRIAGATE